MSFLKHFLKGSESKPGNSSGSTVTHEQKAQQQSAAPAQKPKKTVLDMPTEISREPAGIQPVSQEAIKGIDFLDIYRLPDGTEKTSYMMAFAEAGDAGAQYLLGEAYLFEKGGLKQDFKKAKDLFNKSADQGNSNAMADLTLVCMELFCDLYIEAKRNGESEAEYMPKAMELIDESAYNLARALTNYNKLALNIYNGSLKMDWNSGNIRDLLIEKTNNAMPPLLEDLKAEDKGYTNYILGMLTMRGIGTPQDINQAKMYFERGAELGSFESKFELENPLFTMDDDDE